jgi:hypothetical protein
MDALDTELVLIGWDEARTGAEKEAARQAMVRLEAELLDDLRAELGKLEADVPVIAERVCSGSASVRDFGALPWAYECALAAVNFTGHYPDAGPAWDGIKRRALAVMTALSALDAASGWSPPVADDEHPG